MWGIHCFLWRLAVGGSEAKSGRCCRCRQRATCTSKINIDIKNVFNVFFFYSRFLCFFKFLIFQTFFILKKILAKFTAATGLTRSTFKIAAMKQTYDFSVALEAISWASGVELNYSKKR